MAVSEEQFEAGKKLAIQMASAYADREGVSVLSIGWKGDVLAIETLGKKVGSRFARELVQALPDGKRNAAFLRQLRDFIRSLD